MTDQGSSDLNYLLGTADASEWAAAFSKVFPEAGKAPGEGTMLGWFANAIETGKVFGHRAAQEQDGFVEAKQGFFDFQVVDPPLLRRVNALQHARDFVDEMRTAVGEFEPHKSGAPAFSTPTTWTKHDQYASHLLDIAAFLLGEQR